jgi:CheY-like chemotaxis protein
MIMKKVNLLLGNCEDVVNDLLQATVEEVCAGRAEVNCIRTAQLDEFIRKGRDPLLDLVILIPNNLLTETNGHAAASRLGAGVRAIQAIKSESSTPVIAIPVFDDRSREEPLILEAGADRVIELPFQRDELVGAVGQLLRLPARSQFTCSGEGVLAEP